MRKPPVHGQAKPLWICPKCGARFVTRNLWHSCGQATMKDWNARMTAHTRTLCRRFTELIGACGPFHLAPAKSRIAILARVRFAGVTAISERSVTISFALPTRLRSPRFTSVSEVAPGWWAHRIKISDARQFDAEVRRWVRDSYRLMGMQERLATRPPARRR